MKLKPEVGAEPLALARRRPGETVFFTAHPSFAAQGDTRPRLPSHLSTPNWQTRTRRIWALGVKHGDPSIQTGLSLFECRSDYACTWCTPGTAPLKPGPAHPLLQVCIGPGNPQTRAQGGSESQLKEIRRADKPRLARHCVVSLVQNNQGRARREKLRERR